MPKKKSPKPPRTSNLEFSPSLSPEDEKQAIRDRVERIVGVPGPIRDLLTDPDNVEKDAADFTADIVEEAYAIAANLSAHESYPNWEPSHLEPPEDGDSAKMDNHTVPGLFVVRRERLVPNPEPPPDEIEERYHEPGPSLEESVGPPWITRNMRVSVRFYSVDDRTSVTVERQSYVVQAMLQKDGKVYAFDVGAGHNGEALTRTYYEIPG